LKLSAGKKYLAHAEIIVTINALILDIKYKCLVESNWLEHGDLDDHFLKTIVERFRSNPFVAPVVEKLKRLIQFYIDGKT
jgi:hypothetical protein